MTTQPAPGPVVCQVCGAKTGDDGLLCRAHTARLVAELREVPGLLLELEVTVTRADRVTVGSGVGRSAERPLTWNEHAAGKRDVLLGALAAWGVTPADLEPVGADATGESDVGAVAGAGPSAAPAGGAPEAGPGGPDARAGARGAGVVVRALRVHPDAGQAYDEIGDAIRGVRQAIDRPDAATRFYAGPCPETRELAGVGNPGPPTPVPCSGEVWAFIPTETTTPATLRCRACKAHWGTESWLRVGHRMLARMAELRAPARPV